MRCPACGATNSDRAAWCTQCFASFTPDPPTGPAEPAAPASSSGPDRDVRTRGGDVEWRCGTCAGWNPLAAPTCGTCGAPRQGFGAASAPPPVAAEDRTRLLVAGAVLPGLGHLLAGRVGTGVARVVLAVTWAVAAVLMVRGPGLVAAAPPIIAVLVLWLASLHDVDALVRGRAELLTPRRLAALTGVVVVALVVTVLAVAGGAGRGG